MKKTFLVLSIFVLLNTFSCNKENQRIDDETIQLNNQSITTSENIIRLKSLLDFKDFEPKKVKFQYIFIDNSKGLLAGPSDDYLSAIMHYDKKIVDSLIQKVEKKEYDIQISNSEKFFTKWFDNESLNKVKNHQDTLKVYYDFLFNSKGKIILFEDMILYRD